MVDEGYALEEECSAKGCGYQAVEQSQYEMLLCLEHLHFEMEWDKADDQNKMDREEYGQFETDKTGSY